MIGNLDAYRIFHAVSRNGSFSGAARELYMTQSAVSQAIAKLERELDVQLFYRTSKGVVPTNEGKLLNERVHSALRMIDAAEEQIAESKMLKAGRLRIAVGDAIARYFLMPHLASFHFRYPGVKLTVLNGTTAEIREMIKSGIADIGMVNLPLRDEQLEIVPCKEIRDIFVCGEKYRRLTRRAVGLGELAKLPLIFLEDKSNTRAYVDQFLKKRGVNVSPAFELGSHDLVLEFARSNLGISCVVKEFAQHYLERGVVYEIALEEEIPRRSIGICYLKRVPLSRAAKTFAETILHRA
jgi:DNA-binding transcriptional LysR family regulator